MIAAVVMLVSAQAQVSKPVEIADEKEVRAHRHGGRLWLPAVAGEPVFSEDVTVHVQVDERGVVTSAKAGDNEIIPHVAEVIKRWNSADLSATLDRLNICFSPINRPEDLFDDPHVLRPGGLVNNINADGEAFRVPALPIEWNGASIGEGLKVPVLGADTSAIRSELESQEFSATGETAVRLA